jgi:4-amino-4-deoxy-L-arabinose transferase-like glycosyltransferase
MNSEFLSNSDDVFGQGDIALARTALRSRREILLSRVLRVLLWSCGIFLLAWAFRDSRFRDAEGFVSGAFCLPITASIALFILGAAITTSLRRPAFWFALAMVGQAVSLQLINAGHALRYQHYQPFGRHLMEAHPLILLFIALQTVLVAAGFKAHFATMRAWIGRNFKTWQILAVGLIFFLCSATVSREVRVYLAELPFAAFLQTLNLANIVLLVLALPRDAFVWSKRMFDALLGGSEKEESEQRKGLGRFAIWAAVWVIALATVLSFFSYERHPHIADEVVYIYHARYLASGMLTMPAPPVPEAFSIDLMDYENNRWFCPVPPGWPLVLAIGAFFTAPWLVNPLLAGLNILLAYSLIRELYDRRTARLVILLVCVSPWYIFMAMNFMTHVLTVTCALAAALAVVKSRKTDKAMWALLAGMSAGFVTLIRPLDGVIVGAVIGLWTIGVGGKRLKFTSIVAFALGCVLVGALQLQYNKMLTGNPMQFPINAYNDKYHGHNSNAYGFGPDRGMGWEIDPHPGHGPLDATINANLNTTSMNFELFGWSTGSLLLVALMLFSGSMRKSDWLMAGVFTAVFTAYFFYYFSGGPDFGARYWFLALIPFVALTVRGVRFLEQKFEVAVSGFAPAGAGVLVAVLSLSALSLVNYFPWRAIDKYHHYLEMRPDIRVLARERGFGKSLVLIRGKAHPDYASAAIYNPLDLHADAPVYAWDRSPQVRAEVLKAYSDRPIWIVNGPSITGRGFEVVEGPMSAQLLPPSR